MHSRQRRAWGRFGRRDRCLTSGWLLSAHNSSTPTVAFWPLKRPIRFKRLALAVKAVDVLLGSN